MDDSVKKSGQAGTFLRIGQKCYAAANGSRGKSVKRVNLLEYFTLAESLKEAKTATSAETSKGGYLYFAFIGLPAQLRAFVIDDNGFVTCKHVASELATEIDTWISRCLMEDTTNNSVPERFSKDFQSWEYSNIGRKIDAFRHVFEAECHDVDVYSVGQVSIYKTSTLVASGSGILPLEVREMVPQEALLEFDDAGRCLAFDLPTACGFHALRGLEIVIDCYLKAFDVSTEKIKTWNDYIVAAKKLTDDKTAIKRPSSKVAAMLDRMRELDRNPLMHPRDTLDAVSANMLFNLTAITAVEMVKDMKATNEETPLLADNSRGKSENKSEAA
jgi:hypothetical protein